MMERSDEAVSISTGRVLLNESLIAYRQQTSLLRKDKEAEEVDVPLPGWWRDLIPKL